VGQLATADTCLQNIFIIKQVVLSLFRRLSARRYMRLLLSAGACSTAPAAIDLRLLPARRSAAKLRPPLLLSIDGTARQTDERPAGRYIDFVPHTMRAASVITYMQNIFG